VKEIFAIVFSVERLFVIIRHYQTYENMIYQIHVGPSAQSVPKIDGICDGMPEMIRFEYVKSL